MSNTSSTSSYHPTVNTFLDVYVSSTFLVFGLAGVLSTSCLMFVLYRNNKLWKKFLLFFLLAVSNLSLSMGVFLYSIFDIYQRFSESAEYNLTYADSHQQCFAKLYPYLITVGRVSSSLIHVFISLERVLATMFPFLYNAIWNRHGKQIVNSFFLLFIVGSTIVATVSGWNLETKPAWICNPPSVFHPLFIKFSRYFPIVCDGLSIILTAAMFYCYRKAKAKVNTASAILSQALQSDPVITKLVCLTMLLMFVLAFIPDTIYLISMTVYNSGEEPPQGFVVYNALYQALPLINISCMLLLHCYLVKEFRIALMNIFYSQTTIVVNIISTKQ